MVISVIVTLTEVSLFILHVAKNTYVFGNYTKEEGPFSIVLSHAPFY